jgi:hypothetical protein
VTERDIEMAISCRECVRQGTDDCRDCLVSFVLGEEPDSLELDVEAARVADLFVAEGLVPHLRFVSISSTRESHRSSAP